MRMENIRKLTGWAVYIGISDRTGHGARWDEGAGQANRK